MKFLERAMPSIKHKRTGTWGFREADDQEASRPYHEARISIGKYLLMLVQLTCLLLAIRQFQLESQAFVQMAGLAFAGALIHALLPFRYRLPFFLLLSLLGIELILGLPTGTWLVGIGLALIGICHLPLAFASRVALLLLVAAGLAILRVEWLPTPWSGALWPILGSMFMFRLIVYLYDLRHDAAPVSVWRTLAYFFLLPNVCFPLFPVVDYKTFRRTYYDASPDEIYQTGVQWMVRGVIHLLLYRVLYYYLMIDPSEVHGVGDLVQYLLATFLLYLRVSGQFHLIVGMLSLFGFHLPETHQRYYLASSFTDFWRRINIYWKDFMLKVFYYPAYFKLRTGGVTQALILSTLFVFVVTWFLHAYQWFWLRGSFLLAWQDILFWTVLAGLVVLNSLYEVKYGRERMAKQATWTWRGTVSLALKTVGTFVVICVLWSLWTSESITEWVSLLSAVDKAGVKDIGWTPILLVVGLMSCGIVQGWLESKRKPGTQAQGWRFQHPAVTTVGTLLLVMLGLPAVYARLGPEVATVMHGLRSGQLNRLDTARLERGYYEDLLAVDRFNSQLWEVYMKRPLDWLATEEAALARPTGDFLQRELVPLATAYTSRVTVHTNRWGMRDRDYAQLPPPHTYRIAVLGASPVMGMGVEDSETFENRLEEYLNQPAGRGVSRTYEVLNFGVSNYTLPQQLVVIHKALAFQPQAVFYVAHPGEASRAARYLWHVIHNGIAIPYDELRELVRRAGVETHMSETAALRHLRPFHGEILSWLAHRMVEVCRAQGVVPVWIYLPLPEKGDIDQRGGMDEKRYAERAGFLTVDLSDVYAGHDGDALRLAEWDGHPNAKAHQLIASRLYEIVHTGDFQSALGLNR